jgi:hypothetical protein
VRCPYHPFIPKKKKKEKEKEGESKSMHLLKNVKRDETANRKTQIMMILKSGTTAMAMQSGKKPKFGKESTHGCHGEACISEAASPSYPQSGGRTMI